jgi:hypothetical protein
MCLEIKSESDSTPILQVATEDIVVYKFLECTYEHFKTPYRGVKIKIGSSYHSKLLIDTEDTEAVNSLKKLSSYNLTIINIGIHSFKNLESAIWYRDIYSDHIAVKCIIPNGSSYYLGEFKGCECYASDNIKYISIIED